MLHKVQHLSPGRPAAGLNVAVFATLCPAGAKKREKCCRKYNISPFGRAWAGAGAGGAQARA
ncbi:MAG: hypothetical protein E7E23_23740, partial [Paenibacillus sp.]|uniref:hypothetical protein n=1 Tax=Paenibacillus sp. TaxID=58172 RepID=UPI002900CACE